MHFIKPKTKALVILIISILFFDLTASSQSLVLDEYITATNDLEDPVLHTLFLDAISQSQFIVIGEEHGYKENTEITSFFYKLAHPLGFNSLCLETDSIAAQIITENAASNKPIEAARKINSEYPFSIPFYNSPEDYSLFQTVVSNQGEIWGIDQAFMTQFRLNFARLNKVVQNDPLKIELSKLEQDAHASFQRAIETRDFQAPFIFQYSDSLHDRLIGLCETPEEKRVLNQLKKSREIYALNFTNHRYENNLRRSHLMKDNFLSYYWARPLNESAPKTIFKLGANHAGRGLNKSGVYDISNLLSELAFMNGMSSTHIMLKGIKGEKSIGNPFSPDPTTNYDNRNEIPQEVMETISNSDAKFFVLNLNPLRKSVDLCSDELADLIFKYDLIIFIDDSKAITPFN